MEVATSVLIWFYTWWFGWWSLQTTTTFNGMVHSMVDSNPTSIRLELSDYDEWAGHHGSLHVESDHSLELNRINEDDLIRIDRVLFDWLALEFTEWVQLWLLSILANKTYIVWTYRDSKLLRWTLFEDEKAYCIEYTSTLISCSIDWLKFVWTFNSSSRPVPPYTKQLTSPLTELPYSVWDVLSSFLISSNPSEVSLIEYPAW